jgi:hypothetical protein
MEPGQLIDTAIIRALRPEMVARHGRNYAEIGFAYCDDGQFRFSIACSTATAARWLPRALLIQLWPRRAL